MTLRTAALAMILPGGALAHPAATLWEPIGPPGGFVDFVVSSPAAPTTVYVASRAGGGVYVSADSGTTWRAANAGLTDTRITALAVSPADASVVYAATQSGGFETTDGGSSWAALGGGFPTVLVEAITIDPGNPATLYVCGASGALSTTSDGGKHWFSIGNEDTTRAQPQRVAVEPAHGETLYLATALGGVFRSTDRGRSWDSFDSGLENSFGDRSSVQTVAVDPSNPSRLYAGTTTDGIFVSTDSGRHWARSSDGLFYMRDPNPESDFRLYFIVSDIVVLADGTAYAAQQYGIFMRRAGSSEWDYVANAAPVNDFALGAGIPPTIYAAVGRNVPGSGGPLAYGGFERFDAAGWYDHMFSFVTVWSIATDPYSPAAVVFTAAGSFTYAPEAGSVGWGGPNPYYANFSFLLPNTAYFDPRAPGVVYAGSGGRVYKSVDRGRTYTTSAVVGDPTKLPSAIVEAFLPEPGTPGLFAGTTLGLYVSEDGGVSWVAASSDLNSRKVFALTADASDGSTLWAGTDDGVYRSADAGAHWTRSGMSDGDEIHAVISVAGGRVLAGGTAGLFASQDGGATWAPVPGVGVPVNALAQDPRSDFIAAGTAAGVYESFDRGATWAASEGSLDNPNVVSLAFLDNGPLLAGTSGGVFERFVTQEREAAPRVRSSAPSTRALAGRP